MFAVSELVDTGEGLGLADRPPSDLVDQCLRDRRSEQRIPLGDDANAVDQLFGGRIFQHEPAGASAQRSVHVIVKIECREHHHAGSDGGVGTDDLARLDAVHLGHADIHQNDVGFGSPNHLDCVNAVGRFTDHGDVGFGLEDHAEPGAYHLLVVDQHHPDHWLTCAMPGRVIGPARAGALGLVGSEICTRQPPPGCGPAVTDPPTAIARSCMPTMP